MKRNPRTPFAVKLDKLMRTYPEGPMTISELSRQAGMPRSTIHRHLAGGMPNKKAVRRYSNVLRADLDEMLILCGHRTGSEHDNEVLALATDISKLDLQSRRIVQDVVDGLRRRLAAINN